MSAESSVAENGTMQDERLLWLIKYLIAEKREYGGVDIPQGREERFRLYRSLVNIRMPDKIGREYLATEDEYLKAEAERKGITRLRSLTPVCNDIYLWQGDITAIDTGAIVNAANSQMLGCFCPCHSCIDNCIHTFAGVRLRLKCNEIMQKQGHKEQIGKAKITPAYNLPSRYVIHTVGPIVNGLPTENDKELLASCYRSSLELAEQNEIKSIAFCCISTGEFHFPNEKAAKIAVKTVRDYKSETGSRIKVVFNVFKDKDCEIYKKLLCTD